MSDRHARDTITVRVVVRIDPDGRTPPTLRARLWLALSILAGRPVGWEVHRL